MIERWRTEEINSERASERWAGVEMLRKLGCRSSELVPECVPIAGQEENKLCPALMLCERRILGFSPCFFPSTACAFPAPMRSCLEIWTSGTPLSLTEPIVQGLLWLDARSDTAWVESARPRLDFAAIRSSFRMHGPNSIYASRAWPNKVLERGATGAQT